MSNTVYLSSHGIADARAELERLTAVERPEVVARIVVAREFGDLKENAEYETARKDQSILEGRIERLTAL
ncbi:MAG TPA: transcription elongation factor GreA, partial [Candidatus Nanopelagicales bacterium]|nr:transcription elongation factor GreA [Candidatus Nanopelagicales bacterium]